MQRQSWRGGIARPTKITSSLDELLNGSLKRRSHYTPTLALFLHRGFVRRALFTLRPAAVTALNLSGGSNPDHSRQARQALPSSSQICCQQSGAARSNASAAPPCRQEICAFGESHLLAMASRCLEGRISYAAKSATKAISNRPTECMTSRRLSSILSLSSIRIYMRSRDIGGINTSANASASSLAM
jgi:hypothetical protein